MNDHLLIATAYNNEARIYVSYTKSLVEDSRIIHNTWPTASAALGRLLTAAAMMSFFNKDNSKLTLRIDGDGPLGWIVAESNYLGEVRGNIENNDVYLKHDESNKLAVGSAIGNGFLTVIRNPGLKSSFTSTVELVSGEIAEDLTYYFSYSEQTPSSVGLGVLVDEDNTIKHAGGFIIQVLPFASEETISTIENIISDFKSVTSFFDKGGTTESLLSLLANNTENILEKQNLKYSCSCNKDFFGKTLAKLDDDTLNILINEDKGAEIICQYCHTKYHFSEDELRAILENKKLP